VHGTLSSRWEWAIEEGTVAENIVRAVKPPNPKMPTIQPFEADEIKALLRQTCQAETAELRIRHRTLILFLLDTGVCVSELVNIRIIVADLRVGTAMVQGKGRLAPAAV
jgi:site-specific recombinase XerD